MLHVPGMPEGVHVSFSPEQVPALALVQPDPVFALIEAHRAAFDVYWPLLTAWSDMLGGTPEYDVAEAATEEPHRRERVAFRALLGARPATAAGLWALTTYLPEAARKTSPDAQTEEQAALDVLREGALRLGFAAVQAEVTAVGSAHVDPHIALLPALRQAWTWDRGCRPILEHADDYSPEGMAARTVTVHCWDTASRIVDLPAPKTLAGLGVLALAMSVWAEGAIGMAENDGHDHERYPDEKRFASAVRAMMSVADVEPLPGWTGFEYSADSQAQWAAMLVQQGEGSLPAWALAGNSNPEAEVIATGEEATPTIAAMLATSAHSPISDLARACNEQVERMAQWDRLETSEPLTDEQLDADLYAWGAVLQRAIAEPSASRADLVAKARLMLADLERCKPAEKRTQDDERLMVVILREIIAQGGQCCQLKSLGA